MIRKLTLAAGFGAGYVLGAKAGTQRYDQISAKARELMGLPAVQDFTSKATSTASAAADKAKATVNEKVEAVSGKSASSGLDTHDTLVDLGSHGAATTLPPTTLPPTTSVSTAGLSTGPVAGAAPSGTAPDVL